MYVYGRVRVRAPSGHKHPCAAHDAVEVFGEEAVRIPSVVVVPESESEVEVRVRVS